jgi:hypothetical protein
MLAVVLAQKQSTEPKERVVLVEVGMRVKQVRWERAAAVVQTAAQEEVVS